MKLKLMATLSSALLLACTESTVRPSPSSSEINTCNSLIEQSSSLNAQSSYRLAHCYAQGRDIKKDHVKAAYWLQQSANQGLAFAQFKLAQRYYLGFGVEQNTDQAIQLFTKASNQGNHPAEFYLGYLASNGIGDKKSDVAAFSWYKKSAEGGYKLGQSALSEAYEKGIGVDKSWDKRTYWLETASFNHQQQYKNELRIPLDDTLQDAIIIDYFSDDAQFLIGDIYLKGDGLEKDTNTAIDWFTLSANERNKKAQLALAELYVRDNKNIDQAILYYTSAANSGEGMAQLALAKMYYAGELIPKNINKAIFWASLAKQNHINEAEQLLEKLN